MRIWIGCVIPLESYGNKMNQRERVDSFYNKYIKRMFDVIISVIAIALLSPVLLIIAILIRVKLGKPIIFRQSRPGKDEKIFDIIKFRTMTYEKDENGELLPDELRLTGFGKWLRTTSLDELPELFNILKGDLSIVGPRPLLISYLDFYSERERLRHKAKPGLTGLAQVSGRNYLAWDERLEKDVEYVENISFALDVRIFVQTIIQVLKREDIAVDTDKVEGNLAEIRKEQFKGKA